MSCSGLSQSERAPDTEQNPQYLAHMQPFDVDGPGSEWAVAPSPEQADATYTQDSSPMYEPDAPPASDATSSQWAPYDNTAFIPPVDDFDPQPMGVSEPPSGRQYGMYRQPPTWQHASLAGEQQGPQINVAALLQGFSAIAVAVALGYGLTGKPIVAAGAGVGMAGALQLPSILQGQFFRAMIGGALMAGAYWLVRDEMPGFSSGGARANFDGYDENEGDDEDDDDFEDDEDDDFEPNDDDEDDGDDGDEEDDEGEGEDDEGEVSASSPWMREH